MYIARVIVAYTRALTGGPLLLARARSEQTRAGAEVKIEI